MLFRRRPTGERRVTRTVPRRDGRCLPAPRAGDDAARERQSGHARPCRRSRRSSRARPRARNARDPRRRSHRPGRPRDASARPGARRRRRLRPPFGGQPAGARGAARGRARRLAAPGGAGGGAGSASRRPRESGRDDGDRPAGRGHARRAAGVLVFGASTGGPRTADRDLSRLGRPSIPVLVAIHMPADQTAGFAAHLSRTTRLDVVEAGEGPVRRREPLGSYAAGPTSNSATGWGNPCCARAPPRRGRTGRASTSSCRRPPVPASPATR